MSDTDDTVTQPDGTGDGEGQAAPPADNRPDGSSDGGSVSPKTYDESYVRKLRDEAGSHRTKAKSYEQERDQARQERDAVLDELRKLVDPDSAETDDPAELAKKAISERDEAVARARDAQIQAAAGRAARALGADEDALMDSRGFLAELVKLDPSADDFADQIRAAVEAALEKRPGLRVVKEVPPPSTVEMTGGGENTGQLTRADLKTMTPRQIEDARKAGKLRQLLGG